MVNVIENWCLLIEYDGSGYVGWQTQPRGKTIQDEIEKALTIILRQRIGIRGAGRTDAGVHALGQRANFKTNVLVEPEKLRRQVNAILPKDIVIRDIDRVDDDFDARRSAVERVYSYMILSQAFPSAFLRPYTWWISRAINVSTIKEAADRIKGEHDFSAFTVAKEGSKIRVINNIEVTCEYKYGSIIRIRIDANAFLHHMVRLIVGTLVEVGVGKLSPLEVDGILESKNNKKAGPRAPAKGLYLEKVVYL